MPKPLKPCKYGRNTQTGRCFRTPGEAFHHEWEAQNLERERSWEARRLARERDMARRLAQAAMRERVAGQAAVAEHKVRERQAQIERRIYEAELAKEQQRVQEYGVRTARKLLDKLNRIQGMTPAESRARLAIDDDVMRAESALRRAGEEAFYKRRPRSIMNGMSGIFGH